MDSGSRCGETIYHHHAHRVNVRVVEGALRWLFQDREDLIARDFGDEP